jgi:hypothetical protein
MGTIGITMFATSFVVFRVLERSSPTTPVSATHQVYQMNSHGYLFYVTPEKYWLIYTLLYGGWGLVALAAILNWRWKVIRNLTPQGWQFPK